MFFVSNWWYSINRLPRARDRDLALDPDLDLLIDYNNAAMALTRASIVSASPTAL